MTESHDCDTDTIKIFYPKMAMDQSHRRIPISERVRRFVNWLGFGIYSGPGSHPLQLFKNQIEIPCKKGNPRGFVRLQVLLDAICLRRTKSDKSKSGEPLVKLPIKNVLSREVVLEKDERKCYDVYHSKAKQIILQYNKNGNLLRYKVQS